jgi:hypothetical protein
MHILVDLDGTVARCNPAVFVLLCNYTLKLNIPRKDLENLTYEDFLQRSEVSSYRQQIGEAIFNYQLSCVKLSPVYWRSSLPVPSATKATMQLSSIGNLSYATCRKITLADPDKAEIANKINQDIEKATHEWLMEQGFPHPNKVFFCTTLQEKLTMIAELIQ